MCSNEQTVVEARVHIAVLYIELRLVEFFSVSRFSLFLSLSPAFTRHHFNLVL
jgi:hypothetical protein